MDSYNNMKTWSRGNFFRTALFSLALASAAAGQQLPFQMQYTDGGITTQVANASLLTLAAPLGGSQSLVVRATYTGTGQVTVTQPPVLSGSAAFTAAFNQPLPAVLTPGQAIFFTIRYAPSSPAAVAGRLTVLFAETPASTLEPITLSLQGVSSALVLSYTLPEDNNVVPLAGDETIPFPQTLVGASSPVTLGFHNIGSTLGQVTRISISGSAFRLQGVPLLPATVQAGQALQVQVLFRPTATGSASGTVTVETVGAAPVTIQLAGTAVAPNLTYEWGDPLTAISPGGTISLAADPGQSTSVSVRVTNKGTASASITSFSVAGQTFSVAGPVLPYTVLPNASQVFTVTFTPTRTGPQQGTLTVNSDVFNLSGNGLGAQLSFSYTTGANTISLSSGSAIIFSPVKVTASSQILVEIRNVGTAPTTILNLGIGQANTPFSIANPPAMPATLAPNAALRVNIQFEPTTVGFANASLLVDNNTFALTGSGTQPPALPAYTISGPSGTVTPLTQPSVGLKLAAPYPVAVSGVLTLAPSTGSLPADPAVQFATGGRTIPFRIPANTTDAILGAQGTQVGLQTGTVAGTATLTPAFATQIGNVDLTPVNPVVSQFTVAAAAPTLVSVQLVSTGNTSFSLVVTGFSTTRTLSSLNIDLTPVSGYKLPATHFTLDLKSIAATWFQSTASQTFGGQFRVTIPFSYQLTANQISAGKTALGIISAVSASAVNESGTSTALAAQLQ